MLTNCIKRRRSGTHFEQIGYAKSATYESQVCVRTSEVRNSVFASPFANWQIRVHTQYNKYASGLLTVLSYRYGCQFSIDVTSPTYEMLQAIRVTNITAVGSECRLRGHLQSAGLRSTIGWK